MEGKRIIRSATLMMALTVVCKVLGFAREVLIARSYGAGTDTDAYFLASNVIITLSTIATPIASATIPVLMKVLHRKGVEGKQRYASNLANIVFVVTALVAVLGALFSPVLVSVIANNFSQEQYWLAVRIVWIGLPAIVLSALLGVFRGYLQSEGRFADTALSDLILNLSYIVFLLFLAPFLSIQWLMGTMIVACIARLALQIYMLRGIGYRHCLVLNLRDEEIRATLVLIIPVFISSLVNDLNGLIDKSFASSLNTGTISALNYASKTNNAIMAIFITSLVTVLFPNLSAAAAKGDGKEMKEMISGGLRAILALTIPATVGLIFLAQPVVKLAFERGAFDASASQMTAECLVFYSIGLVGMSLRTYLEKAFYAAHDTKTPMLNAVIAVLINVVLNLVLIRFLAHKGLALATSVAAFIASFGLLVLLRKKVGSIGLLSVTKTAVKSLIASMVMGIIVLFGRGLLIRYSANTLLELIILGGTVCIGVAVYAILMILMKEDTFMQGVSMIRARFPGKR